MISAGTVLEDTYHIKELIGEGSSSFVYRAADTSQIQYAVKVMKKLTASASVDAIIRLKTKQK